MNNNEYTITFPNGTQQIVQGNSISTSIVTNAGVPTLVLIGRLAIPSQGFPEQRILTRLVAENPGSFWQVPGNPTNWCKVAGFFNYYDGNCRIQQFYSAPSSFWNYVCNSFYFAPDINLPCTSSRCDLRVVTDTQVILFTGVNGQPCPTWTTRSLVRCLDTEIECPDPSDPRGFCCIPCDSLNSKIRALI